MADCSLKCKAFEQDSDGATNPVREYKRYTYLKNVSHWKLFVFNEKHSEDLRMSVLLNNADRYINESIAQLPSQESQELVPQLVFPNGLPSEESSWAPLPGSWNQKDSELLLEEVMEMSASMMDNSRTVMNLSTDPASGFYSSCQGQVAGRSGLPDDLLADLFSPTGEDLLKDPGWGPDLDGAGPTLHDKGDFPSSTSNALATNSTEENSIWDAFPQEELLCNNLLGNFEVLAENYLQDLPLDDVFADIDTSTI